jgi:hypothetical protein
MGRIEGIGSVVVPASSELRGCLGGKSVDLAEGTRFQHLRAQIGELPQDFILG